MNADKEKLYELLEDIKPVNTANGIILTACTTGIRLADVGQECS